MRPGRVAVKRQPRCCPHVLQCNRHGAQHCSISDPAEGCSKASKLAAQAHIVLLELHMQEAGGTRDAMPSRATPELLWMMSARG